MFFTEEKGLIISPVFISYSSILVSITQPDTVLITFHMLSDHAKSQQSRVY